MVRTLKASLQTQASQSSYLAASVFKQDLHKALGMTGKFGHKFVEIKLVKTINNCSYNG